MQYCWKQEWQKYGSDKSKEQILFFSTQKMYSQLITLTAIYISTAFYIQSLTAVYI